MINWCRISSVNSITISWKPSRSDMKNVKWFWTHIDSFKASGSQQRLMQMFNFTSLQLRKPSPWTLNPKPKIACPLQRTLKEFGGHQFSWSIPVPKQNQQANERRMRQKCEMFESFFLTKTKWKVIIYWFQKKTLRKPHTTFLCWYELGWVKCPFWLKHSCLKPPEFCKTPWLIGMSKAQMKNWCL